MACTKGEPQSLQGRETVPNSPGPRRWRRKNTTETMEYRDRGPGESDSREKISTHFLVLTGVRTVDREIKERLLRGHGVTQSWQGQPC